MMRFSSLKQDTNVSRAEAYLLAQSRLGFAEAAHKMTFPMRVGFHLRRELQIGDIFARAVLATVCADIAEFTDEQQDTWLEVARQEATYVANSRLKDRDGGWSYFPGLHELPPDLDSLGAALHLFGRVAPIYLPLCDNPIRWALAGQEPNGALSTWIIAPTNTRAQNRRMQRGIKRYWGDTMDIGVCARFLIALAATNGDRYRSEIDRGIEFVLSRQRSCGLWEGTWYWGDVYVTGLCLRLLAVRPGTENAVRRAVDAIRRLQRKDGGWGTWESVPLDTALALWAILPFESGTPSRRLMSGSNVLFEHQVPDGSWPATAWIKMEPGRVNGDTSRILTYQSRTITTAFVLRTLLAMGRFIAD